MLTSIRFKIKHPNAFKFIREGEIFLLIFIIIFAIVFALFNGRAFYDQIKYTLGIGIEESEEFINKLPVVKENLYNVDDSIVIPKTNTSAPIVSPETTDEKILFNELEKGVVYYPSSSAPGQIGNIIILGHSSAYPWYKGKYGSVFSLLNQLENNDQVIIFYQKHKYIYMVTAKEVVAKNAAIANQNEKSQLILISCWPVGTAWKRILVKADLQEY